MISALLAAAASATVTCAPEGAPDWALAAGAAGAGGLGVDADAMVRKPSSATTNRGISNPAVSGSRGLQLLFVLSSKSAYENIRLYRRARVKLS